MKGVWIDECARMIDIMEEIGDEVGERYQWFAVYYEFAMIQYPKELPFGPYYVLLDWGTLKEAMKEVFQIIWGSFSAIPKGYSKQEIIDGGLVDADEVIGKFFQPEPRKIEHPLADIEILFSDGSEVTVLAKDEAIEQRVAKRFAEYVIDR